MPSSLTIPHNFSPRPYQLQALQALDSGIKRIVAVWHRRAGKEKTFINYVAKASFQRVGTYFYIFPTYNQARKVLWDGRDKDGFPFMAHFPRQVVKGKPNESEMRIELVNGSAIQLIGSDNIDSIVGTNPVGCVFSEYALQDPKAWDYMRPILRENKGFAIFDYTPRGKNHGYDLYQMAKANEEWFAEILTVDHTKAISKADIEAERREGMSDELIQQEYYCSFEGVLSGSVFGKELAKAESEGRICPVPWIPEIPVETWWDPGLGFGCWMTQTVGRDEIHVIDHYGGSDGSPEKWAKKLNELPYVFGAHHGPPDIESPQYAASGKSVKEIMHGLNIEIKANVLTSKEDQIRAARRIFPRCWFDRVKTASGRNSLSSYHFKWDDKRKMFLEEPYHDWSSHDADAFMQLGVGHKSSPIMKPPVEIQTTYSPDAMAVSWLAT